MGRIAWLASLEPTGYITGGSVTRQRDAPMRPARRRIAVGHGILVEGGCALHQPGQVDVRRAEALHVRHQLFARAMPVPVPAARR